MWHCSKRKLHYQLTDSHLSRLCENVKELTAEMGTCDVTFCDNDAVLHQKRFYQKIVQKTIAARKHRE